MVNKQVIRPHHAQTPSPRQAGAGDRGIVGGTLSEARTYYGADGRVSGRSITGSNRSTTIYGADGRVTGRTSTDSGGTVTVYGADGRRVGTVKPDRRAKP